MTFILENYVYVSSKSIEQKNLENNLFVGVLKVNDENSSIWSRIRIRTKMSRIRNTGKEHHEVVVTSIIEK